MAYQSERAILYNHLSTYTENKLSINMVKTNCMIIKSIRKRDMTVNIQVRDRDGMYYSLVHKGHLKYLGVMIDNCVS